MSIVLHFKKLFDTKKFLSLEQFNKPNTIYVPIRQLNKAYERKFDSHILIFGENKLSSENKLDALPLEIRNNYLKLPKDARTKPKLQSNNLIIATCIYESKELWRFDSNTTASSAFDMAATENFNSPLVEYIHFNDEDAPLEVYQGIVDATSLKISNFEPSLNVPPHIFKEVTSHIQGHQTLHQAAFLLFFFIVIAFSYAIFRYFQSESKTEAVSPDYTFTIAPFNSQGVEESDDINQNREQEKY